MREEPIEAVQVRVDQIVFCAISESDIQNRKYSLDNWNEHFQVVVCWVLWKVYHD